MSDLKAASLDEGLFALVFFQAYPLVLHYSAAGYAKLVGTYSPTLSLEPDRREAFLRDLAGLIEAKFNGVLEKRFTMTLTIAKKKS